jgi:hypothetical protein
LRLSAIRSGCATRVHAGFEDKIGEIPNNLALSPTPCAHEEFHRRLESRGDGELRIRVTI